VAKSKKVNILTVCGVGSGSSLILRMYTEDVLEDMGIRYTISAGQASEARGTNADIVMCAPEFYSVCEGSPAQVVIVKSFTNKDEIRKALTDVLIKLGYLQQ
jgi:PTS system ascorbate-specific IIB component